MMTLLHSDMCFVVPIIEILAQFLPTHIIINNFGILIHASVKPGSCLNDSIT